MSWMPFVLILLGFALGCGGGAGSTPSSPSSPPAAQLRFISPATTDPAITTFPAPHAVIAPSPANPSRNRLFVFLPGTGGQPQNQQLILATAAGQGYHATGLSYPNTPSIGSLCNADPDPDAHWKARKEIVTGSDLSPLVDIAPSECIEHRLSALLAYLVANFPEEGWAQFLSAGAPAWDRITVAGHSQGGGHAGVIGKLHAVARVVCFSSPADWRSVANQPASWYAQPGATGPDRIFGFSHQQDELVTWSLVTANWSALGLQAYGSPVEVDTTPTPYGASHQLSSRRPHDPAAGNLTPFHGSTVVDAPTPKLSDGSPAFRPVWIQLCFP